MKAGRCKTSCWKVFASSRVRESRSRFQRCVYFAVLLRNCHVRHLPLTATLNVSLLLSMHMGRSPQLRRHGSGQVCMLVVRVEPSDCEKPDPLGTICDIS